MTRRQPTLPWLTAQQAKRDAIDQVERGADADWMDQAQIAVAAIAAAVQQFTTDDIWKLLGEWNVALPRERRVMGAAMRRCVQDGLCVPTWQHRQSERAVNHARPLRVWQSCIYKGQR